MTPIYIWQRIVSPHMAGLAAALAATGTEVVYVAEQVMSADRAKQGWQPPGIGSARLELAPTIQAIERVVAAASPDSIHICQGIRGNGLVNAAQQAIAGRELRQWVIMETVDDAGWLGVLKRLVYRREFRRWSQSLDGVLATGALTPAWVAEQGIGANRVFPFAYFLPDSTISERLAYECRLTFRFVFVGQLIQRKRIDLLISAISKLNPENVELVVIGNGPLEKDLRSLAEAICPGMVRWMGQLPMSEVPTELARADCLVLPSRHDGWGAVVSEALMAGIPAICSDRCGATEAVTASSVGGVFSSGDVDALARLMGDMVSQGPLKLEQRQALAQWAGALGAKAGAQYLLAIFEHLSDGTRRPLPPWRAAPPFMT